MRNNESTTTEPSPWNVQRLKPQAVIIFHFEGMSFSSAHDLKQWDFLDNNEIFSEFAQFIRQHILTILTIKFVIWLCQAHISLGADSSLICTC